MLKTVFNFQLLCFNLCQVDVRIPLILTENGNWLVRARTLHAIEPTASFQIHFANQNVVCCDEEDRRPGTEFVFDSVRPSISFILRDPSRRSTRFQNDSFLGIAPNSPLVQSAGSVAVVHHGDSAQLIIGSQLDTFNRSCVPGSLMQFQSTQMFLRGFFHLPFNGTGDTVRVNSVGLTIGFAQSIIQVKPWIAEFIIEVILGAGGIRENESLVFSNCTRLADSLPVIELALVSTVRRLSFIRYYPEDYVELRDGSCRLLLSASTETVGFNPLKIPNTNMRVSDDDILEICDGT